jgi:hypothetical protein
VAPAVEHLALVSTASAAAATPQAPIPLAEPFKVCANAAAAAGVPHMREQDLGVPVEVPEHLASRRAWPSVMRARRARSITVSTIPVSIGAVATGAVATPCGINLRSRRRSALGVGYMSASRGLVQRRESTTLSRGATNLR